MKKLSAQQVSRFHTEIYSFYRKHRRQLPWRSTKDPYHILISEIMLQQTQVDRVTPKYIEFLRTFPTARALARASLSRVLKVWSGLGYNRRARAVKQCAEVITNKYEGRVPETIEELDALPGIGYHTAGAIMAFAFNKPVVFIETNIRSVFIHHFFPNKTNVSDEELEPLVAQALDWKNPRKWYSALMDFGSVLKKKVTNPSRRSAHHSKQAIFEGSNRQLRGKILKALIDKSVAVSELQTATGFSRIAVQRCLAELENEELILRQNKVYTLAS